MSSDDRAGADPVRVLLADDKHLVRAGFRLVLERDDRIEVIGEAADGAAAVELARRLRPDVVVMDIRMPVLDGLEATRRILDDERTAEVVRLDRAGHGGWKAAGAWRCPS